MSRRSGDADSGRVRIAVARHRITQPEPRSREGPPAQRRASRRSMSAWVAGRFSIVRPAASSPGGGCSRFLRTRRRHRSLRCRPRRIRSCSRPSHCPCPRWSRTDWTGHRRCRRRRSLPAPAALRGSDSNRYRGAELGRHGRQKGCGADRDGQAGGREEGAFHAVLLGLRRILLRPCPFPIA